MDAQGFDSERAQPHDSGPRPEERMGHMKRNPGSVMFVMLVALAAGCARGGSDVDSVENALIDRDWVLHRLRGEPVALKDEAQRPNLRLATKEGESWMSGFTGCNRMFGTYELAGERLAFGGIGATKMACAETMDLERVFLGALQSAGLWRIEDGVLILSDDSGAELMRLREGVLEKRPGGT